MKINCFLIALIFLFGCGSDGSDGNAYLEFSWDYYVDSYWDNNPGVPTTIRENESYRVNSGTFSYEYDCSDGSGNYWGYEGSYTITINKGSDGSFLTDGDNGADKYFFMSLTGFGTTFSAYKNSKEKASVLNKVQIEKFSKKYVGEIEEKEITIDNSRILITKQMFILTK